ncbi:cbb3-type cytochrome oxidase assembly protein CcoS [Kiritimatiellota bacterium B12222]|nr:cbb3-type cytochrome oxidase assembly protein CcoS [Kiritimatiellota bacterium B12222]
MSAIIILLVVSLMLALCFLAAFLWSVHKGQFDDPVTPALRMLHDDETSSHAKTVSEPIEKEPSL